MAVGVQVHDMHSVVLWCSRPEDGVSSSSTRSCINTPNKTAYTLLLLSSTMQRLPPEVVRRIVEYLMIDALCYDDSVDGISYLCLETWNQLLYTDTLLNLACTCKYFRSVIYSEIFKACLFYRETDKANISIEHGIVCACQDLAEYDPSGTFPAHFMPQRLFYNHEHRIDHETGFLLHKFSKPQFHLTAMFNDIATDALQHIQHLCLVFNGINKPYCPWMGPLIYRMVLLKEFTLNLDGKALGCDNNTTTSLNFADLDYVIEKLLQHGGITQTHVFIKINFELPASVLPYLAKVGNVLAKMEKLKVESLLVQVEMKEFELPKLFLRHVKRLTHLKRFIVKGSYGYGYEQGEIDDLLNLGYSVPDVIGLLEELPNLEQVEIEPLFLPFVGTGHPAVHEWKLKSSIRMLGVIQPQLSYCRSEHVLQSITFLSLHFTSGSANFPVLPNLETLALFRYGIVPRSLEGALQHFSSCSHVLKDLVLLHCETDEVPDEVWSACLAEIKQVEVHESGEMFKQAIMHAPKLQQYYSGTKTDKVQLGWLVDMMLHGKVSRDLRLIYFSLFLREPDAECLALASLNKWLKQNIPAHWPRNIDWDFVNLDPIKPISGHFTIDVPRLLAHVKKYH